MKEEETNSAQGIKQKKNLLIGRLTINKIKARKKKINVSEENKKKLLRILLLNCAVE